MEVQKEEVKEAIKLNHFKMKEEMSEKETWPVGHVDQTLPQGWMGQMKLKKCVKNTVNCDKGSAP